MFSKNFSQWFMDFHKKTCSHFLIKPKDKEQPDLDVDVPEPTQSQSKVEKKALSVHKK